MKKNLAISVLLAFVLSLGGCSFAKANDDAWKDNVGTVNLDTLTVSGDGIEVQGNIILISEGGDFEVTGGLQDGMIKISTDSKVKLRLSGMSLTNSSGPAIYFENVEKGFITITENTENYIKDGETYTVEDADAAIFSNDDLEIKGAGTLTVEGNYKHGIASDDGLSVENGTITVTAQEHGIKANNKVTVSGGSLNITAKTGKGIKAGEELVIDDGVINIVSLESEGMESKGTITINGGDISIEAADDGINTGNNNSQNDGVKDKKNGNSEKGQNQEPPADRQGVRGDMPKDDFANGEPPQMPDFDGETPPEMKDGRKGDGNRERRQPPQDNGFTGGERQKPSQNGDMPKGEMGTPPQDMPDMQGHKGGMNFGGFGEVDEETAAAHAITINGGKIYIKASGDGIDSNGSLTITGGTVKIDGPEMNGNGPLDSAGEMTITGGEIITLSSAGMLQLPNSSDVQNTLKVVFGEQGAIGDTVTVKDSSGNELMVSIAEAKYSALIYSSEKLKAGEEYGIYVNGNLRETVTAEKGVTSVGNSTGFMGGFGQRGNAQM